MRKLNELVIENRWMDGDDWTVEQSRRVKIMKLKTQLTLFESSGVERSDPTGFLFVAEASGDGVGCRTRVELNGRPGRQWVASLERRPVFIEGRPLDRFHAGSVDGQIGWDVVILSLTLGNSADDAGRVDGTAAVNVERVVGRGRGDPWRRPVVVVLHARRRVVGHESRAGLARFPHLVVSDGPRDVDGVRVVRVGHGHVDGFAGAVLPRRGRRGWRGGRHGRCRQPRFATAAGVGWRWRAAILRPLHLTGRFNDQFDPVRSFVVGAAAAHRLAEIVQHGPWCSRQVA